MINNTAKNIMPIEINQRHIPKRIDIFTRDIPHVLVAGTTDEIYKTGRNLNKANLSTHYNKGDLNDIPRVINSNTIAILLVSDGSEQEVKSGILRVREVATTLPVFLLKKNEFSDEQAKLYFTYGVSDIIYSVKEIPRFKKFILEHRKLGISKRDYGASLNEKRISKAVVARIRSLTNLPGKISISVRNKTAFVVGKIQGIRWTKLHEKVVLATPGISNLVITNLIPIDAEPEGKNSKKQG